MTLSSDTTATQKTGEPLYGGCTRFELELEVNVVVSIIHPRSLIQPFLSQFVQSLANPYYLNHLASQKLLQDPSFIAYLHYLQYFAKPEYMKYLLYPGPTLKALELLQQDRFRQDILSPDTVRRLAEGEVLASIGPK